jgi:hypothetical protein
VRLYARALASGLAGWRLGNGDLHKSRRWSDMRRREYRMRNALPRFHRSPAGASMASVPRVPHEVAPHEDGGLRVARLTVAHSENGAQNWNSRIYRG